MKKQNIAIIGVVAFILAIAVGYALFSETITINGTATAKGNLDVQFTSVGTIASQGYTKQTTNPVHELAKISDDGKTLTITVNKLDYPGAYVEIPVTVTNLGSIPAVLKNIAFTGDSALNDTSSPVKVSFTGLAASDTPIETNDTHNLTVRVEWLANHGEPVTDGNSSVKEYDQTAQFAIQLNYQQITVTTAAGN